MWSSFGAEIRTAPMTHTLLDSRQVASPAGARLCSVSTPKIARKLGYFGDDVGWACTAEVLLDAGYGIASNRRNLLACGPLQSRLRVRIDYAPPSSPRFSRSLRINRKYRARSRSLFDLRAPENLRFGRLQLILARFSLSRTEPVPFPHRLRKERFARTSPFGEHGLNSGRSDPTRSGCGLEKSKLSDPSPWSHVRCKCV